MGLCGASDSTPNIQTQSAVLGLSQSKNQRKEKQSNDARASLPETGLVRLPVLLKICGIAESTVWKWCADGRFPKPVKLSPRVSAWPVAAVRAWLANPLAWQATTAALGTSEMEALPNVAPTIGRSDNNA